MSQEFKIGLLSWVMTLFSMLFLSMIFYLMGGVWAFISGCLIGFSPFPIVYIYIAFEERLTHQGES